DRAVARGLGPEVEVSAPEPRNALGAWYRAGRPASDEAPPRFVLLLFLDDDVRVVLPGRHVEEAGAGTVRGRIPVRPALDAGIGRSALRLRRLDRPPLGIQPARPVQ